MLLSDQISIFFCLTTELELILFGEDGGHPFIITNKIKINNSDGNEPFSCAELKINYKNNVSLYKTLNTFFINTCNDEYH